MRYREGTLPDQIGPSPEAMADAVAAGLGLVIDIALVLGGLDGRQRWLVFWGSGLVLASLAYLTAYLPGQV